MNNYQHNALYNGYIKIKPLIKRDGITLATEHLTTTIFKYMPLNNSHVTQNTCKNQYSAPGTNIMNGSVSAHTHTHTHTHTHSNYVQSYLLWMDHIKQVEKISKRIGTDGFLTAVLNARED